MSIDFSSNNSSQAIYGQSDIDHSFSALQQGSSDINSAHPHSNGHLPINGHGLDRPDSIDMADHNSYDIFSSSASGSLASQRYRTNASSSSSLGPNYALGVDSMYPTSSFTDTLPPFHPPNNNPYDLMNGLSSSYSSGKPSPLTPNDPVGTLQHNSGFPFSAGTPSKEFSPHHNFPDSILDRRLSTVSNGYSSEFNEDYSGLNVNTGLGLGAFPPSQSAVQQFQDRLGRMPNDSRYSAAGVPPLSVPTHLHQGHSSDLIRGVAPQATHSYRPENGMSSYDDIPQFLPNPQVDFPLRIHSVDENLARLRLQGAGDLQTFIRLACIYNYRVSIESLTVLLFTISPDHIWTSMFALAIAWRLGSARSSSCLPKWLRSRTGLRNGAFNLSRERHVSCPPRS